MRNTRLSLSIALICLLALLTTSYARKKMAATPNAEARHKALEAFFHDEWEYELQTSPEFATSLGDKRYNDRLSDSSAAFYAADLEARKRFLARLTAIEPNGLAAEDALNRELMIEELGEQIEGAKFKFWEMPVNQMGGPHLDLPDLIVITPFNSVRDYENYIARLRQVPRVFAQTTANMRQGMRDGLMPPRYLLEKVATETNEIAALSGKSSPFAKPIKKFPAGISEADQRRLRAGVLRAINGLVVPSYKKFAEFVSKEYAPHGRSEPGVWSLPNGGALYRYRIRRMTTTDLTPEQIHQLGFEQLKKTEAEMLELAHRLGFKDLASLNQHIKEDRGFYATSGQQVLDLYTKYAREMETELPKMFGKLPRNKLAVIPMEESRQKNAVPADYSPGAADGSRPGHINVNEYDPEHRLLLNIEAIAYHEGVPGHHLQISLAQEMTGVPDFRRQAGYTAFVEGWALYSERLGKDVGRYQDPYSDYGRLENEMWRNIRLIIDTGVHEKHWSREQMVEYFHKYTVMDEPNVQSEVDRYIAWPGQALAYKLGQLEILKLRDEAKRELGAKFDIRAFHDAVLGNGALPLNVLDERVKAWIEEQKKK